MGFYQSPAAKIYLILSISNTHTQLRVSIYTYKSRPYVRVWIRHTHVRLVHTFCGVLGHGVTGIRETEHFLSLEKPKKIIDDVRTRMEKLNPSVMFAIDPSLL